MDAQTAADLAPARRKWRRLATWISIPILLAGVVFGFWAWTEYDLWSEAQPLRDKYQPRNLSFSAKRCSGSYAPFLAPSGDRLVHPDPRLGIKRMFWDSDGRLVATVHEVNGCSSWIPLGRYTLKEDALKLEAYATYRSDIRAACDCIFEMEFRIAGLPVKAYKPSFAWLSKLE
jgi:hypothetical protein